MEIKLRESDTISMRPSVFEMFVVGLTPEVLFSPLGYSALTLFCNYIGEKTENLCIRSSDERVLYFQKLPAQTEEFSAFETLVNKSLELGNSIDWKKKRASWLAPK